MTSDELAPLAFIDTETTGLDPVRHEVWEVAAIIDGTEHTWQLPVDLGRADPVALRIGRFHERRLPHGELTDLRTFAAGFAELTRGAHLVGAVPSFDERRLGDLLRAHGACPEWHYHLVDVEALAAGFIAGRSGNAGSVKVARPPWDSSELTAALGIEVAEEDKHTALGDARWAKAIYDLVMA